MFNLSELHFYEVTFYKIHTLVCDMFSFVFRKKLKTPKRHFEIIWPLLQGNLVWRALSYAYWVINDDWQPWTVSQDIWCQKNDFSPYSQPLPLIWFSHLLMEMKNLERRGRVKDMTIKQKRKKILLKSIHF